MPKNAGSIYVVIIELENVDAEGTFLANFQPLKMKENALCVSVHTSHGDIDNISDILILLL